MPQSLASVYVHLTFSTLDRTPFLEDRELRIRTHAILGGISKKLGCQPLVVGGVADHVHILGALGRTVAISDWVKELKRASNSWLKDEGCEGFAWQAGYGAFSVGYSGLAVVRRYIETQEEHHHNVDFKDEFRRLMRENGIEWDELYVWK